jgi:hypothetical protein
MQVKRSAAIEGKQSTSTILELAGHWHFDQLCTGHVGAGVRGQTSEFAGSTGCDTPEVLRHIPPAQRLAARTRSSAKNTPTRVHKAAGGRRGADPHISPSPSPSREQPSTKKKKRKKANAADGSSDAGAREIACKAREEEVAAREEAADQLQQATATGSIKAVLASPGKSAALAVIMRPKKQVNLKSLESALDKLNPLVTARLTTQYDQYAKERKEGVKQGKKAYREVLQASLLPKLTAIRYAVPGMTKSGMTTLQKILHCTTVDDSRKAKAAEVAKQSQGKASRGLSKAHQQMEADGLFTRKRKDNADKVIEWLLANTKANSIDELKATPHKELLDGAGLAAVGLAHIDTRIPKTRLMQKKDRAYAHTQASSRAPSKAPTPPH